MAPLFTTTFLLLAAAAAAACCAHATVSASHHHTVQHARHPAKPVVLPTSIHAETDTQALPQFDTHVYTDDNIDSLVSHPVSVRAKKRSFPRICPCKQIKARTGKCYYFTKFKLYKCKSRTCVPRYVCVPRKIAQKIAKKFGKKLLMCVRRVTRRKVVPWIRKGLKGYCKSVRTRRRVFYVPYVRK